MKLKPRFLHFLLFIIGSYWFFHAAAYPAATHNVWDVLRNQFALNHETRQPQVQAQLRWLISHPHYLQKLAQSEPYIYHIVTEIKKRKMPGELALLPMIESAYDPFAYSLAGAAGLWQFMPGTGNDFGLKQDWWFDARRSIRLSTEAALNYLLYLKKYFNGNWILAIAAYDSGEGTVARAIKKSQQSRAGAVFWTLAVPKETKNYVPRLLALAEIIQHPERYRVSLPNIPHIPYFVEVHIGSQIDLNQAAQLAGISYQDLIKLNPGYNHWTTAPHQPFKLLIPANKVARFSHNLAHIAAEKRTSFVRYQIRAGDHLSSIAQRHFTTVKLLRELNQLQSDKLTLGQFILIPSNQRVPVTPRAAKTTQKPTGKSIPTLPAIHYKVIHIVQAGESYLALEKKYRISLKDIQRWNHLAKQEPLRVGQSLILWKSSPLAKI